MRMKRILTTAHLLRNHDNARSLGSSANSGNSEQLNGSGEHVCIHSNTGGGHEDFLLLDLRMDVIQFSGGLDGSASESQEGLVCLVVSSLGNEPPVNCQRFRV